MKHCTTDKCPQILDSSCVFYEGASLIFSGINTNDSVETVIQKLNLKLESIPVFNSNNYYTKQEVIDGFKPISYNPNIDEVLANGNNTSHPIIIQRSFGGSDWENTVNSVGNYFKKTNIGSGDVKEIVFGHEGINSTDSSGSTGVGFAPKTKNANITIPNENGTVVLDYQLNDYYKKTETFSQTEITDLLNNKQNNLGYTPENITNKSDSYTASSSTTYSSTKALVDGLATKQNSLGYTPENTSNKQNSLNIDGTGTKYPTIDAINSGLDEKENNIISGTISEYFRGDKTWQILDKNSIGLNNVDNVSDLNKPISIATQAEINLKADKHNPIFTGTVSGITPDMIGAPSGSGTVIGDNTGDNSPNSLYSGLISNATHTGEVEGDFQLVLNKTSITNKINVVASLLDEILISDESDLGKLKKVNIQSVVDLVPTINETMISSIIVLNFLKENDKSSVTVFNSSITNLNIKAISFIPIETAETSLDDFSLNGLNFSVVNIVDNTSFDIIGTAINNASGNYTIKYIITINN